VFSIEGTKEKQNSYEKDGSWWRPRRGKLRQASNEARKVRKKLLVRSEGGKCGHEKREGKLT